MTPEDIADHIENLRGHFAELEALLADPAIYSKGQELKRISQEHRKLENLFQQFNRWVEVRKQITENNELYSAETDAEFKEIIAADIESLEEEDKKLEGQIRVSLLPPDPNDARNIIVEIKPAAGGDEAALFAGEVARLYMRYAEQKRWKLEILDQTPSDLGGLKSIAFSLSGDDVYSRMKYESGVHRVQRIPETETNGRVHTSTITVSVMPEAEAVEINIKPEELRFDVFRSSGPGGQCVNTTDSAVRVTHIPTGVSVASQQEKSQHRNKEIALRILYARLLEHKQREEQAKFAADKRSQVGTGDRSERIRTYNFPQSRCTDHRFGVTLYDLTTLMEGDLDSMLEPIIAVACEQELANLGK